MKLRCISQGRRKNLRNRINLGLRTQQQQRMYLRELCLMGSMRYADCYVVGYFVPDDFAKVGNKE